MKSIFKDSFNEFMVVIKNVKLIAFTLIAIIVNLALQRFQGTNTVLIYILLLPMLIVNLVLNIYQYITIPKLITTKKKDLIKFFQLNYKDYGNSIINLVKSMVVLILVSIGVIVSIALITVIFAFICGKVFDISKTMAIIMTSILMVVAVIFMLIAIVRLYLFVPLTILVDVDKPLNYCWKISKGNFWKILCIILFTIILSLPSMLFLTVFKNSPVMLFIVGTPLNCVISNIIVLISINTLYYVMNKDSLSNAEEPLNVETI